MAAWKHSNSTGWNSKAYQAYRDYVMTNAASYKGAHEDCADLSVRLLIRFAAKEGLAVSFGDNAGRRYISKAEGEVLPPLEFGLDPRPNLRAIKAAVTGRETWNTPQEFTEVVEQRIGAEALWKRNTARNWGGPQAGDLMLTEDHAALVFGVYAPGQWHPKWRDVTIPDFPGDEAAKAQVHQLEYYKGTVSAETGVTSYRRPDDDYHFDYLNSRSKHKRNAELIYFANKRQAVEDGFVFCSYGSTVLDNWFDWDGDGSPPR
jgi:hypothetical protein